jgi:dGTPase
MKNNWAKLLTSKRFKFNDNENKLIIQNSSKLNNFRSAFSQDYDRIIFSNSFRRLSRKTQVHPLSKNDHIHNRLTHSLEVASVGRSLGLGAGELLKKEIDNNINPSDVSYIVQTACLAHDIGNPPFGHAGEDSIKKWFKDDKNNKYLTSLSTNERLDFEHFDGNAQSFRIVCEIENNLYKGGMCLSLATLGALVKYPRSSQKSEKFSFFQSEKHIFDILFNELGLIKNGNIIRHPLSYLMEVADDICYSLLDIKDAIELKIIKLQDVLSIFKLFKLEKYEKILTYNISDSKKASILSAFCINVLTSHAMEIFELNLKNLTKTNQKHFIELFTNRDLKEGITQAKKFGYENIFKTPDKKLLEIEADKHISVLLDTYIQAVYNEHINTANEKQEKLLQLMLEDRPNKDFNLYRKYQRVVDYISGMTDNYVLLSIENINKI